MADVSELITLGIGTPADIKHGILFGLSPSTYVFSGQALMYAQSAVARSGATRSDYHSAHVFVTIAGTQVAYARALSTYELQQNTLTITDILDETPNTCAFTIQGITPTVGQEVIVNLGSTHNLDRLFAGHILSVAQVQVSAISTVGYQVRAIDYTWLLSRVKVIKKYTNQSATAIAQDLITSYSSGFTSVNVQASLATVDEITFTNEDLPTALTRLAKRIGGYWYVDYHKDVHFFTGVESGQTNPTNLTTAHTSLSDFRYSTDLSQEVTRVYVEGGGVNALEAVAVGETIVPVEDSAWYGGGTTVVAGPQRITYTGVVDGGTGTVIGPGVNPSSAPALTAASGAGVESGLHAYAYTWVTAAGETLPSAQASLTVGSLAAPASAPVIVDAAASGSITTGSNYQYEYTYSQGSSNTDHTKETLPSPASAALQTAHGTFNYTVNYSTDATVTYLFLYRTTAGSGTPYKQVVAIPNNTAGGTFNFGDSLADASLGVAAPGASTAGGNQVALSGIAVGPAGTTSRKIYRTVAAGTQLKLQQTIANNTATTGVTDATADASLGANVPTSDTSALTQPTGQINAGATSILTAGWSFATAGWAVIGNGQQVIRYTGVTGNTLTGIPASGTGAITAPVTYNTTITVAPQLTGVPASGAGSVQFALLKGDPLNLLVTVDDPTAQAALAALLGTGDGVQEEYIQDNRLSFTEALARGEAFITLRNASESSLRYTSRDKNTASGRTITVSLGSPTSVSASFKIQQVVISNFVANATVFPNFDASASSTKFSFEDLLRLARKVAA